MKRMPWSPNRGSPLDLRRRARCARWQASEGSTAGLVAAPAMLVPQSPAGSSPVAINAAALGSPVPFTPATAAASSTSPAGAPSLGLVATLASLAEQSAVPTTAEAAVANSALLNALISFLDGYGAEVRAEVCAWPGVRHVDLTAAQPSHGNSAMRDDGCLFARSPCRARSRLHRPLMWPVWLICFVNWPAMACSRTRRTCSVLWPAAISTWTRTRSQAVPPTW